MFCNFKSVTITTVTLEGEVQVIVKLTPVIVKLLTSFKVKSVLR